MKSSILNGVAILCTTAALGGCVVAPVAMEPAYAPPPGVVYVAPTYAMPAPGYAWQFNARFGWGWRHPQHGWHRGWR
jgi:hypothetical protein